MTQRSMTGFGRGEAAAGLGFWVVELRTVNHRFLDIIIRIPRQFSVLEEKIKDEVGQGLSRGRVEVFCEFRGGGGTHVRPDVELARAYMDALGSLGRELSLESVLDLEFIARLPDVLVTVGEEGDVCRAWPALSEALTQALAQCLAMRQAEGTRLCLDLRRRLDGFTCLLSEVEAMLPLVVQERKARLDERLKTLLGESFPDPARLAQEVAILVDRSDVSEEKVRLQSHIGQFARYLDMKEATGRRLDFLLQEFMREVNTMAAKIGKARAAYVLVEMKNELEKMREQVQNLE